MRNNFRCVSNICLISSSSDEFTQMCAKAGLDPAIGISVGGSS